MIRLLLLLILLCPASGLAAPDSLSFAESLARQGDHFRAVTEFKRFLHFHPEDPRAPRAQLGIAASLRKAKRWQELDQALELVWSKYPDSPEASLARQHYAEAAAARGDFARARSRYEGLRQDPNIPARLVDFGIGLAWLEEERLEPALMAFSRINNPPDPQLQALLLDYQRLPRKSPHLAGTLSALLPGAGQLYTERPRQAAMAFALNAAFIYGAIEAWNQENYAVSGLVTLFEIGWYGGNIVNAVNNAHKYNRRHQEPLKQQLRNRLNLTLGLHGRSPWLQARLRF